MDISSFYTGPSAILSGSSGLHIDSTTATRRLQMLCSSVATGTVTLAAK
jgi:hypothetical protein